ncbi:uncharacterized protein BO87DRAFT_451120 [Aspergillus neoniger CBS 115656]|uniref:Uncharacterized protein n=1 Tax=Aspergillus neoniger (strain CBS 115656) TaxID=1448310 RepID=A0A318YTH2_ASPNB|nr:hypothetical protein BO87DRAFT_451120 [Aspergillus neoniger CBS 115656]PYH28622.1 hypothetical protein BO87DRAFT_451120 [Aspergillus neoniger CBS 115656]
MKLLLLLLLLLLLQTLLLVISARAFLLPPNMFEPFRASFDSNKEANQALEPATLPITYKKCYNLIHIDRGSVQQSGGGRGMYWEPLLIEHDTLPRTFQVCEDYKADCPSPDGNVTDGGLFYLRWISENWGPLVISAYQDQGSELWPISIDRDFIAAKVDGDDGDKGFVSIRGNNEGEYNGLDIVFDMPNYAIWNAEGDGPMKFRFDEVECKGDPTRSLDAGEHGEL